MDFVVRCARPFDWNCLWIVAKTFSYRTFYLLLRFVVATTIQLRYLYAALAGFDFIAALYWRFFAICQSNKIYLYFTLHFSCAFFIANFLNIFFLEYFLILFILFFCFLLQRWRLQRFRAILTQFLQIFILFLFLFYFNFILHTYFLFYKSSLAPKLPQRVGIFINTVGLR